MGRRSRRAAPRGPLPWWVVPASALGSGLLVGTVAYLLHRRRVGGYLPIGAQQVEVLDVPVSALSQTVRTNERRVRPRAIFLHTNTGQRAVVQTRSGPDPRAEQMQRQLRRTSTQDASWDFAVDGDSISVSNNLLDRFTWGQNAPNPYSVTIEMTIASGVLDARTIRNTVSLVDSLTAALQIQRQYPAVNGAPFDGIIDRFRSNYGGGRDCVGIFGHRNVAFEGERGHYDPGDAIFEALREAGYEGFDFNAQQDKRVWVERQRSLGVETTGVPLWETAQALERRGYPCGVWVRRPIGCPASARATIAELQRLRPS